MYAASILCLAKQPEAAKSWDRVSVDLVLTLNLGNNRSVDWVLTLNLGNNRSVDWVLTLNLGNNRSVD